MLHAIGLHLFDPLGTGNGKEGRRNSGFQGFCGYRSNCLSRGNTRKFGTRWNSSVHMRCGYTHLYIRQNPYSFSPKRMTFTVWFVFCFVGRPVARGVPRPGIRLKPQLWPGATPDPPTPCARLGSNLHPGAARNCPSCCTTTGTPLFCFSSVKLLEWKGRRDSWSWQVERWI